MTKFEALKAIAQGAGLTVADVCSEPNIDLKNALVDAALDMIRETVRQVKPKTPLDLPLGVKLTRYSSPKEVVYIGTRTVKRGGEGETIKKVCRVIVDVENNVAHAYYDTKHIGDAYAKMGNNKFLELSGVEVLHSWLKCIEHARDCRARRKAKASEGAKFFTPKTVADFVMGNPPMSQDNNKVEEGE